MRAPIQWCTKTPPFSVTMATIRGAQRALVVGKGLVTLSSALCKGEHTTTKVGMAVTLSAAAGALVYQYARPWLMAENAKLRQVLEGGGVNPEEASTLVVDVAPKEVEEVVMFGEVPMIVTTTTSDEEVADRKRRIRKGCRGKFVREIVAAVKLRLGTPKATMANRRAVQRVAREELQEYNLRKVVAASVIPTIVEAVFVPNKWEIQAAQLGTSCLAQARRMKIAMLLEMAGFNQA